MASDKSQDTIKFWDRRGTVEAGTCNGALTIHEDGNTVYNLSLANLMAPNHSRSYSANTLGTIKRIACSLHSRPVHSHGIVFRYLESA